MRGREPYDDVGTIDAEDIGLLRDHRPTPPDRLDDAAYYGLFGELVRTLEPHTEADPAALLIQAQVMFGSQVGRGPFWQVEDSQHRLNLFAVLVGPTSKGRKGTSGDRIVRLGKQLDPTWPTANGLVSGEGLIWAVRNATSEDGLTESENARRSASDPGVIDKRLYVAEPEFGRVLRTMGRDGNTLSAVLRESWDGGVLSSLSKQSRGRATDAHISMIGHITVTELQRYLTATEAGNGFGNRILWVWVTRSKELPEGGSLQAHELGPILVGFRSALDWGRSRTRIGFDSAARDLWHHVYHDLSAGRPGLLGSMTTRAEAQARRLACLYALADRSSLVERPHLEAGLAVWQYCYRSAEYIFGGSLGDPVADELLRALRTAGSLGLTRTQINSEVFGRNRDRCEITRALSMLSDCGLAFCQMDHTTARPTEWWFAVTNLTK